jgi:class 3 adenylate cyclase
MISMAASANGYGLTSLQQRPSLPRQMRRPRVDATSCAIEIQRSLKAHRRVNGFAPKVRIGIHAARAMVGGGEYQGAGVHVAARIGAAAAGGEILASLETARAAGVAAGETRDADAQGGAVAR